MDRGKRRRSGLSENKTPEKKARYDIPVAESSKASTCEDEWKNGLKKKRRRRRTKGLREMVKNKDNLPEGCTNEKICRIARKYGSVVQVHLPKSATRPIPSVYGTIEMGRRPKSFAFVQFTDPDACQRMCTAFSVNTPGEGMKQRSQPLIPLLQRLLMQIRTLSRRRRRRTCAQNILLIRLKRQQAAIIKKERSATKRSHKISRAVERDKGYGNVEQENGKWWIKYSTAVSRKRQKRRLHEIGPHTIGTSVHNYFERLQVFTLARYRELREEYVALRRESNRHSKELAKQQQHFVEFRSKTRRQKLNENLGSYRERFWYTNKVEEE
ncbi:hypothetical protein NECAME_17226 [Necator americanus]|uniref:RRM domain-containing protein n=1 Tax=Necator americanus TaxID=51031 RepID=W2TPZ9_NECAM|nr:hypothetical protein NECAME_17226 [Necator americanus]ETN84155.1 hypothetical protein NECAME_17226 [Necator americanus]